MPRLRARSFVTLVSVFLMFFSFVVPAFSSPASQNLYSQNQSLTNVTSTNWSGYAVSSSSVTDVKGSWVAPSVTCTSKTTYSSFWVGIDGYTSKTVEQTGTDSDCSDGTARYYGWYEFYPAGSVDFGSKYPVKPGDHISAEVSVSGADFTVTMKDSSGWTFSITKAVSSASKSSAEWIVERPEVGSKLSSLSDFGKVGFTSDYATINGVTGPISSFTYVAITMKQSGKILDKPSALSKDGTGTFTVTWRASS